MKPTNPRSLLTTSVLLLAMACMVSPGRADVIITATPVPPNEVIIGYDATSEAVLPRAFSLNIQVEDANIIAVGNVNPDFPIHPGTINIDLSGPQPVIDYGSPVAPLADLPSDTLPGLDTNSITIEMASLYAPTGPGSPNAPDHSGPLLSIFVDGDVWCLTITGNVARAGSSGVVLEDPNKVAEVIFPTCSHPPPPPCRCCPTRCHGDFNCDGTVNTTDFFCLKDSWFKCKPDPLYSPYCDFNCDGCVNTTDFFVLKDNWFRPVPPDCPIDPLCPHSLDLSGR